MKRCTKCKQWKDESEFYKHKRKKNGLDAWCGDCHKDYYQNHKDYFVNYRKKNKDKRKEYRRNFYKRHPNYNEIHKEERTQAVQRFFQKNRHKEEYRKTKRKDRRNYYIRHPGRVRNGIFKERQLSENFTNEEWEDKVKKMEGICPICNRLFEEGYGLSLDHNPPVSKAPIGFTYTINDIQPICLSCNCAKRDRFESYNCKLLNFS